MAKIFIVWQKEIIDNLKDRRTLLAMVLGPILIIPLIMILPGKLLEGEFKKQEKKTIAVAVKGGEKLPSLSGYLKSTRQVRLKNSSNLIKDLKNGELDTAILIEAEKEGIDKLVKVKVLSDMSKDFGAVASSRITVLLERFNRVLAENKLRGMGIEPSLLEPLKIRTENIAEEKEMGAVFLSFIIPLFLAIGATIGGMYTAIDVTAGEKERGTLEPLLTTPVPRFQIVIGKLLAVFTTAMVTTILAIASLVISFRFAPEGMLTSGNLEKAGTAVTANLSLSPSAILLMLLLAIPMVALICSVEIAICLFAKSFKEAQNYLVPLQFIVLLPILPFSMLPGFQPPAWGKLVPVFGTVLSFRDIIKGTVTFSGLAATLGASLLFAMLAVYIAVKLFHSERLLLK